MSALRFVALALTLVLAASTPAAAETRQHDAIGRLTDISYTSGGSIHYTFDANGNILSIVSSTSSTGVDGAGPPLTFSLGRITPNPGSGPRRIEFVIPSRGQVSLHVFDLSGREVAPLFDRVLDPGRYTAEFSTARWAPGTYFYRLEFTGQVRTDRLTVVR